MGPVRGQIVINPEQRFKSDRQCPVCGGHAGLPRAKGIAAMASPQTMGSTPTAQGRSTLANLTGTRAPTPSPTF